MARIFVGVGEFAVSKTPGDEIKTMALGSCVAVITLDPISRIVGLLHVALPDSSINAEKSRERPGMFADSGIPALLQEMTKLGYRQGGRLIVKLAGGATIMDPKSTFNIGKRNILAVKKILWKYRLGAVAEHLGENYSRTVSIDVSNGRIIISSPGRGQWKL
ncbi:MAG: chemotaxis protein CheD [FCB group bacterium]|nr:chemotaxis protein CheD [FCB group bacterium]